MLLDEWERSGGSAAQFADYVGIKYWTLANWIQKRRKQIGLKASFAKPGAVDSSQSHGHWVEAIAQRSRAESDREFVADLFCSWRPLSDP